VSAAEVTGGVLAHVARAGPSTSSIYGNNSCLPDY
jgi:hypothetical protein